MKKFLIILLSILTFIVMLPVSFLFFCLLATIQQGHSVNSIIQTIVMLICSIFTAGFSTQWMYKKLNNKRL